MPFPQKPEDVGTDVTVEVRLSPVAGGQVSGQVSDSEGTPLPGVEVTDGGGASFESDGQGRFVLEYVQGATAADQFMLTAKKGYFEGSRHFLGEAAAAVTLVLKPLPKWSGQVLSPEGLPVKQFHVQAAHSRIHR